MAARVRFAKYRGLKSWRSSPWDPKESLPREYSRVFAFQNSKRAHKRCVSLPLLACRGSRVLYKASCPAETAQSLIDRLDERSCWSAPGCGSGREIARQWIHHGGAIMKNMKRLAYLIGIASSKVGAVVSCSLDFSSPPTRVLLLFPLASLITV